MSNHPDLSAVLAADIPANAKLLYSALYARTNGAMSGAVAVEQIMEELGVALGTLRNLRTILGPWAVTAIERGVFLFALQSAPESQREKSALQREDLHAAENDENDENDEREKSDVQREKSALQREDLHAAENDENDENDEREKSDVQREKSALQREDLHAAPPHTPLGRQVGRLINLTTGDRPTYLPTSLDPLERAPQTRSIGLLRAVGVNGKLATAIAGRWDWHAVVAFVAAYLADLRAGRVQGAGVLRARCLDEEAQPPPLCPADLLCHPLLAQYVPGVDVDTWIAADRTLAAQNAANDLRRRYSPAEYADLVQS